MPYREIIFNNFWLKITALLLAVLVWFTLHRSDKSDADFAGEWQFHPSTRTLDKVQIIVMQSAADIHKIEVNPKVVKVEISGEDSLLQHLSARDVQVFIDMDQLNGGKTLPVRVFVPRGLKVKSILPSSVEVGLVKP